MPESTSISNSRRTRARFIPLSGLAVLLALPPAIAHAEGMGGNSGEKSKAYTPEEDDFSNTPFTEYGEFSESADEEAEAKFMAHGRSHGVSLGLGFEGLTGNRGAVYEGGFPMVDLKLHYWFDFNFAMDLNIYFASHEFDGGTSNGGLTEVNLIHAGIDIKYYFDTKNLSAPISFANPYLMVGFGSYTQVKSSFAESSTDKPDTGLGLALGAGLEFAISPKKCYLELEGRYHMVSFADRFSTDFQTSHSVPDLTGSLFTISSSILFTW
jgi:opacity protein-like surface antigen